MNTTTRCIVLFSAIFFAAAFSVPQYSAAQIPLPKVIAGDLAADSASRAVLPDLSNDAPLAGPEFEFPDADGDGVPDRFDNCIADANPTQADNDADGVGDACDQCDAQLACGRTPHVPASPEYRCDAVSSRAFPLEDSSGFYYERLYTMVANNGCIDGACARDSDEDGVIDQADNCVETANAEQRDRDGDGQGDACDCDDGLRGENEQGADCGGICGGRCPSCIPLVVNGDTSEKIDIVFVGDRDYGGDTSALLDHVERIIIEGMFELPEFAENRCKFNFYYHPGAGDYEEVCKKWELPENFYSECSFADSVGIVFTEDGRACANGAGVFSTPPDARIAIHETTHSVFSSVDEYCCDGGYSQPSGPFPNVFNSEEECRRLSANPDGCYNFCPEKICDWPNEAACRAFAEANEVDPDRCQENCSPNWGPWRGEDRNGDGEPDIRSRCVNILSREGFWKSDTDSCIMESSWGGDRFGPDDSARILTKFAEFPACGSAFGAEAVTRAAGSVDAAAALDSRGQKVIVFNYRMSGEKIKLQKTRIVYNTPPNHFREQGEFVMKGFSVKGKELFSINLHDPREYHLDEVSSDGQGKMMGDRVDFTVVAPFFRDLAKVEIVNSESKKSLHAVDMSKSIAEFCLDYKQKDPQCAN